jgi:hypothetical protein
LDRVRTVLFYRNYKKFHGGHLKVWEYFNHVLSSDEFTARIGFSEKTKWDPSNPWWNAREYVVDSWNSVRPDVFFIAGPDWRMLDQHPDRDAGIPVLNFVQHVRHADPSSDRYQYLGRRAVRICVSEVVADAVRETGRANGPVFAIPNSVDVENLPLATDPEVDVLIAALKQPERGKSLEARLERPGRRIDLLAGLLPRSEYLERISKARVTVFLPNETEGFYLPPLEAMAMGPLVVCPEHEGEQSIYAPQVNCFQPPYELDELAGAVESVLALGPEEARRMREEARRTAEEHSLEGERRAFLEILSDIDRLW